MDQLRADVLLDLLDGKQTATGGTVELRVDLATLARLVDHPGELGGYGPVVADLARQVAERYVHGEWRFVVTDPTSGMPLDGGITRRRPTTRQRRTVEMRDPTCIFPGCQMPSSGCDLDHRIPYSQHRQTTVPGLAPICRHDHVTIRHRAGWVHRALPDGDHLWTSRLGHTYTTSGRSP
jgi:hypothetical protein